MVRILKKSNGKNNLRTCSKKDVIGYKGISTEGEHLFLQYECKFSVLRYLYLKNIIFLNNIDRVLTIYSTILDIKGRKLHKTLLEV